MKKKLALLIILLCAVTAAEALLTHGLNFANPYGKVPPEWLKRAPWSTITTWLVSFFGLILILVNKWNSKRL